MLSCRFFPCYHLFLALRPSSWRPIGRRHVCNENGIANLGFFAPGFSTTAFWLDKTIHLGSWLRRKAKRFQVSPGKRSFFRAQSCNQFGVTYGDLYNLNKKPYKKSFIVEWRSSLQIKSNISALLSHRFRSLKSSGNWIIQWETNCGSSGTINENSGFSKRRIMGPHLILHSLIGWSKAGSILSEILVACDITSL